MAQFPGKENDIIALAQAMVTGFGGNPAVFPNLPVGVGGLQALLTTVNTKVAELIVANAALAAAYEQKKVAMEDLVPAMKQMLSYAETITNNDNVKLQLIGWGAPKPDSPVPPPGQPKTLESKLQGEGNVTLYWGKPVDGGAVLIYKIQRRERPAGAWQLVENSHDTKVELMNQTRGKEYEYRVIANNKAGDGPASNMVMVVL